MAKKRERLEVIRDILNVVRQNRKVKPTRLLYASNLSPQMFKEYVDELIRKKFIQVEITDGKNKIFSLNKKGQDFLIEYKAIENFVDNFGL